MKSQVPAGQMNFSKDVDMLAALLKSPSCDALPLRLARLIDALSPSSRLIMADRMLKYISDLLIVPLAPTEGHVIDEARQRLLTIRPELRAHNDQ